MNEVVSLNKYRFTIEGEFVHGYKGIDLNWFAQHLEGAMKRSHEKVILTRLDIQKSGEMEMKRKEIMKEIEK